jgi:hypothetical protein
MERTTVSWRTPVPALRTYETDVTEARFDELIHSSSRLSIVALLASADRIDSRSCESGSA